jgi:cell division protein FtsN
MSRDYKSRANQPRSKRQIPGWIWFSGGLMVGLFVSLLVWLKLPPGAGSAPKKKVAEVSQPRLQKEPEAPKPRFDFYTILPEMEVVVPEPEPVVSPDVQTAERIAEQQKDEGEYMLQMGSFRKYADADRLKASLALVGLEAEIQRVTVNGDEVFHRVRSGPYTRGQVNSLRARLKENSINSLVIRLRN